MNWKLIAIIGLFITNTIYADNFEGPGVSPEIPNLDKLKANKTLDDHSVSDWYIPQIQVKDKTLKLSNIYLTGDGGPIAMRVPEESNSHSIIKVYPYRGTPRGSESFDGRFYYKDKFLKADNKSDLPFIADIGRLLLARYPDSNVTHKFFEHYFDVDLDTSASASKYGSRGNSLFNGETHNGGFQGVSGMPFGENQASNLEAIQHWLTDSDEWNETCSADGTCSASNPKLGNIKLSDNLKALKKMEKAAVNKPSRTPTATTTTNNSIGSKLTKVNDQPSLDAVLAKAKEEGNEFAVVTQTHETDGYCPPCESMKSSTLPQLDAKKNVGVYIFSKIYTGWGLPSHSGNSVPYTEVYRLTGDKPERIDSFLGHRSVEIINLN